MTRDHVELVKAVYALGLGSGAIERAFENHLTSDFEARMPSIYPDMDTFRGREGVLRWREMIGETWGEFRWEPEHYEEAGDHVVVFLRLVTEASASGVPLARPVAHVWSFREGRASAVDVYIDRDEALAAAERSRRA